MQACIKVLQSLGDKHRFYVHELEAAQRELAKATRAAQETWKHARRASKEVEEAEEQRQARERTRNELAAEDAREAKRAAAREKAAAAAAEKKAFEEAVKLKRQNTVANVPVKL